MEEELANAVEKTKIKNGGKAGKNKSNKNKNKGKVERKPIVKKSVLNMEYPYDLVSSSLSSSSSANNKLESQPAVPQISSGGRGSAGDRGNAPISPAEEEALLSGLLREWNSLPIDDDVELPAALQPKIFSSFYNTPDLFRIGVEVSSNGNAFFL